MVAWIYLRCENALLHVIHSANDVRKPEDLDCFAFPKEKVQTAHEALVRLAES